MAQRDRNVTAIYWQYNSSTTVVSVSKFTVYICLVNIIAYFSKLLLLHYSSRAVR